MMRRNGSILVGLLWCLALLSVVVIGVLHTARLDLLVVKNYGDRVQAHYLALAGIEKAKALLYQDARDRPASRRIIRVNFTTPRNISKMSPLAGANSVFSTGARRTRVAE